MIYFTLGINAINNNRNDIALNFLMMLIIKHFLEQVKINRYFGYIY